MKILLGSHLIEFLLNQSHMLLKIQIYQIHIKLIFAYIIFTYIISFNPYRHFPKKETENQEKQLFQDHTKQYAIKKIKHVDTEERRKLNQHFLGKQSKGIYYRE